MTDRPILFSAPMVLALLAGHKTQTRRVLKVQPDLFPINDAGMMCGVYPIHTEGESLPRLAIGTGKAGVITTQKLRYAKGDFLWVREAWRTTEAFEDLAPSQMESCNTRIRYEADGLIDQRGKSFNHFHRGRLRASIHMPRWALRITLEVTDVRIERLQDINRTDAIEEGLVRIDHAPPTAKLLGCDWGFIGDFRHGSPLSAYAVLWDTLNGNGAWGTNPWVEAYTFKVSHQNIDEVR